MPFVDVSGSPFHDESEVARIYFRTFGRGFPLVFLHGGWGYEVYPFDKQIEEFGDRFEIVVPDRSGYGGSSRVSHFPSNFHRLGAKESLLVLDAIGIEQAVLWGHSDGAVIAANMGVLAPERFSGIILEAFHYDRAKPSSREFFHNTSYPDDLSERTRAILACDHGEEDWRHILKAGGAAWLELARTAHLAEFDLFGGRLAELRVPALFVHGSDDPRTEPGELDAVRHLVPSAQFALIQNGGHAPHSDREAWSEVNRAVAPFLEKILESR